MISVLILAMERAGNTRKKDTWLCYHIKTSGIGAYDTLDISHNAVQTPLSLMPLKSHAEKNIFVRALAHSSFYATALACPSHASGQLVDRQYATFSSTQVETCASINAVE